MSARMVEIEGAMVVTTVHCECETWFDLRDVGSEKSSTMSLMGKRLVACDEH